MAKIIDLPNAPEWLKNAKVKYENVEIVNGVVHWIEGAWISGRWKGGVWHKGTWHDGTWERGEWNNGTWMNGLWLTGEWINGKWLEGEWMDGIWDDGYFLDGIWYNGIFKRGVFRKPQSKWVCGEYKGVISGKRRVINHIKENKENALRDSNSKMGSISYTVSLISSVFIRSNESEGSFLNATLIMNSMRIMGYKKLNSKVIGKALSVLGWPRVSKGNGNKKRYGYWVKIIKK